MSIAKLTTAQRMQYQDVLEQLEEIRQKPPEALTSDDIQYSKDWLRIFDALTSKEGQKAFNGEE